MKKLLALFLACTMVLGLASCKEQDEDEKNTLTAEETVATMQDPIDALARCMVENNLEYNPKILISSGPHCIILQGAMV